MRRYSVEFVSRPRAASMELLLVDAPRWTRWPISLGYRMLKLTNGRHGVAVVAFGYRVHNRVARKFPIPTTLDTVEEFRRWRRRR